MLREPVEGTQWSAAVYRCADCERWAFIAADVLEEMRAEYPDATDAEHASDVTVCLSCAYDVEHAGEHTTEPAAPRTLPNGWREMQRWQLLALLRDVCVTKWNKVVTTEARHMHSCNAAATQYCIAFARMMAEHAGQVRNRDSYVTVWVDADLNAAALQPRETR